MSIFKTIKSWFAPKAPATTKTPEHVDVFGNELHEGDTVVRVKYNDKRCGYATVSTNYVILPYSAKMNFKVLSYDAYIAAAKRLGRKHGYMHVSR